MRGSYGDPENTGVGYNTIIKELGDHTVPAEWAQYVKHDTEADTAPGAPIQWDDPSDPETALPGYGFVADDNSAEETFYYHSDHLGSTSYITDGNGNITQYDAYLPYGELLVDEHSSSEEMPYKFNGKELDEETGLYEPVYVDSYQHQQQQRKPQMSQVTLTGYYKKGNRWQSTPIRVGVTDEKVILLSVKSGYNWVNCGNAASMVGAFDAEEIRGNFTYKAFNSLYGTIYF